MKPSEPSASDEAVLVTGATGNHGRTGLRVVERLVGSGRSVRVLSRRESEKTDQLRQLGADVCIGDLHDRRSLVRALDGMNAVYFAYPVNSGIVPAAANLASAIRAGADVPRVVVMSMAPASPDSPSHLGRAQALAEEILTWSGLDPIVLRVAGFFHENVEVMHGDTIRDAGIIRNNFGEGSVPWIGARDAADVGVAAIIDPQLFGGGNIYYPPGAELLNHGDIAAILTIELEKEVTFETVDRERWHDELIERGRSGNTAVNADMALHISTLGEALKSGAAPKVAPDAGRLEALLGHRPQTFAEYVAENRSMFVA
jgi:uncharacterized protein YbjT (DUF2867 family)